MAWGTDLDCVTTDVSDTVTSDDVMSEGSEEVMVISMVMIWIGPSLVIVFHQGQGQSLDGVWN